MLRTSSCGSAALALAMSASVGLTMLTGAAVAEGSRDVMSPSALAESDGEGLVTTSPASRPAVQRARQAQAKRIRTASLTPSAEELAAVDPTLAIDPARDGTAPPPEDKPAGTSLPGAANAPARFLVAQHGGVRTGCFPDSLKSVLRAISVQFGKPVIVTSGFRPGGRRGSYHRTCQAADIQVAGVSPSAIARYVRGHHAVGGVGTYRHTRSVHVDVGGRVFTWHGSKRKRTAGLGGASCCPACAAMTAEAGRPRFEAVCTG